jgi:hypothetical protein
MPTQQDANSKNYIIRGFYVCEQNCGHKDIKVRTNILIFKISWYIDVMIITCFKTNN